MTQSTKQGRPRTFKTPMRPMMMRFPEEMLEALDEVVAARMGGADRATIIRECVSEHLKTLKRRGK